MSAPAHRVVIAGGGIAAAELLIALRTLAQDRVSIELLAPSRELIYRPLAVAEPFGIGRALRFDLDAIAAEHGARRRAGTLAGVDDEARVAITGGGAEVPFDSLAIAVGAIPRVAIDGALSLIGSGGFADYKRLLERVGVQGPESLVFVVPPGATWPLPLYEIALMTATWLSGQPRNPVSLALVTPEAEPLGVFGKRASATVRDLLEEHRIDLVASTYADAFDDGHLLVHPGKPVAADRIVALPLLEGPRIPGLPYDGGGFIPVDLHGRVSSSDCVWAAGDATTFPIKQGGLAAQQADVVAESIAATAGAAVEPTEFDPVLRGLLLTGGVPTFLRAELRGGKGETSQAEAEALWWPPAKIAGVHLGHYLARLAAAEAPRSSQRGEYEPFGLQLETDDLAPYIAGGGPAA